MAKTSTKTVAGNAVDDERVAEQGKQLAVSAAPGLPAYLQDYKGPVGTENIDSDDITVPRVEVAQDMTQAVQDGVLERGDLFLNLTLEQLAGPGKPLTFIPLAQGKEYILWRPRKDKDGERILARANKVMTADGPKYEWNNQHEEFAVKVEGKIAVTWKTGRYVEDRTDDAPGLGEWGSEIPGDSKSGIAATAHHNYIVYLPALNMVAGLSLSRTKAKKAKAFNSMLKMGRVPVWARQFTIETFEDQADGDKFFNVTIKPAGFVPEGLAPQMQAMFEDFQSKKVTVDQSDAQGGAEKNDERE